MLRAMKKATCAVALCTMLSGFGTCGGGAPTDAGAVDLTLQGDACYAAVLADYRARYDAGTISPNTFSLLDELTLCEQADGCRVVYAVQGIAFVLSCQRQSTDGTVCLSAVNNCGADSGCAALRGALARCR